jgi:hypothetical protein
MVIKSKMRWAKHATCRGKREVCISFLMEKLKGQTTSEEEDNIKWISNEYDVSAFT